MITCKLCARAFEKSEPLPPYLKMNYRRPPSEWAHQVCNYCWIEYERSPWSSQVTDFSFNAFCANEMTNLAKRSAQGKPIYRCEAIAWLNNSENLVLSHRCRHFVREEFGGKRLCGVHVMQAKKGRRVETCLPTPPRFYLAARDVDEFARNVAQAIPREWLPRLREAVEREANAMLVQPCTTTTRNA